MRRRSRASSKVAKPRRRKAEMPKRGTTPKLHRRSFHGAAQETELTRRRDEALERQIATTEVLNLISNSSVDLETIFQSILTNAVQICRANFGFMHLFENGAARIAGWLNVPEAFIAIRQSKPVFHFGPITHWGVYLQANRRSTFSMRETTRRTANKMHFLTPSSTSLARGQYFLFRYLTEKHCSAPSASFGRR